MPAPSIDLKKLNLETDAELEAFETLLDRLGKEAASEAEAATRALKGRKEKTPTTVK